MRPIAPATATPPVNGTNAVLPGWRMCGFYDRRRTLGRFIFFWAGPLVSKPHQPEITHMT